MSFLFEFCYLFCGEEDPVFCFSGFCHWYLPFWRALLPEVSGVAHFSVVSRLSVIDVPWGRSRGYDRHGLSMWGDVVGPVLAGSDDR